MAAETYSAQVIVLRKTKLGESDLILSLLAQDGSQLRVVAKGARKPSNSFAARLELYSLAEVLCCKGRNLDIVQEARLLCANEKLRCDMDYAAGAAPMAELLDKVSESGLEYPRLFEMSSTALSSLAQALPQDIPAHTAAHLLKTLAFVGLRPTLSACAVCGTEVRLEEEQPTLRLSFGEGGVLCGSCRLTHKSVAVSSNMCQWVQVLLASTFSQIAALELDAQTAGQVLEFCRLWIREHIGANLKSLDFLLSMRGQV
ncbi:MAG: DNA repair protein RecO [Eggerthellaceae bacterium]|nr:DNA repair protein RecO [Eggerthellaceae bacterium]